MMGVVGWASVVTEWSQIVSDEPSDRTEAKSISAKVLVGVTFRGLNEPASDPGNRSSSPTARTMSGQVKAYLAQSRQRRSRFLQLCSRRVTVEFAGRGSASWRPPGRRHRPAAMLVGVVIVEAGQHRSGRLDLKPIGEGGDVEVVPGPVATDDQKSLHPQRFIDRRHGHSLPRGHLHLDRLQWSAPDHLPHAGLDPTQLTEDDLPRPHPVGDPVALRLQRVEDHVEPLRQIGQHLRRGSEPVTG